MVERMTGGRAVLSSNPAGGTLLRNFGNSVYPALPEVKYPTNPDVYECSHM